MFINYILTLLALSQLFAVPVAPVAQPVALVAVVPTETAIALPTAQPSPTATATATSKKSLLVQNPAAPTAIPTTAPSATAIPTATPTPSPARLFYQDAVSTLDQADKALAALTTQGRLVLASPSLLQDPAWRKTTQGQLDALKRVSDHINGWGPFPPEDRMLGARMLDLNDSVTHVREQFTATLQGYPVSYMTSFPVLAGKVLCQDEIDAARQEAAALRERYGWR